VLTFRLEIAGRQPLSALVTTCYNLPGIHAGVDAHGRAEVGLKLPVEHHDLLGQPTAARTARSDSASFSTRRALTPTR
jgi:hypothetical protein